MDSRNFEYGDNVRHFKYELLSDYEKSLNMCTYVVLGEAEFTENGMICVIYKSLYNGKWYIRPKESFYSEVDKNKYPNINQKYRFEKIDK